MKPFGNRTEMDEKELEHYISELRINERNKLRDTILVCFLIIGGIIGLFFLLNTKKTTADIWSPTNNKEVYIGTPPNLFDSNIATDEELSKGNVAIGGIRETGESIIFTVQNYNKNVAYLIDFGDGKKKRFKSKKIKHHYKKAGSYLVKIYVEDKSHKKKLYYSNRIDIATAPIMVEESDEEIKY